MARSIPAAILLLAASSLAAAGEIGLVAGRSTESDETDIVRLTYRRALAASDAWWMPTHLQLGASVWRVPDVRGTNRRLINSPTHRLPSSFQFGSHLGAGIRLGEGTIGIVLQHLSNAGLKQPNGGIDLILLQYTVSTGTPKT